MIELPSIQQLENFIIYSKVKDIATAAREAKCLLVRHLVFK